MGDEYHALARAIRRPMRRWWLRVGSWWIGAAVLLLFILVWSIWNRYQLHAIRGLPMPGSDWRHGVWCLHYLVIPTITTAWLLAAFRVNSLVTALTRSIPGVITPLLAMRFLLAWRVGLLPLVLLVLYGYLYGLLNRTELMTGGITFATFLSPIGELRVIAAVLTNMLWVLCLTCFGRAGAISAVIWHIGCNTVLQAVVYVHRGWGVSYFGRWLTEPANPRLPQAGEALLIASTVVVAYLILVLYAKGSRAVALSLATGLGVAQIATGIGVWTGVWLFDIVLRGAMHIQYGSLLIINTVHRTYSEEMWLCVATSRWGIPWPEEFAFVALYVPLAVLAGHYFAISWILRNVRPRRAQG